MAPRTRAPLLLAALLAMACNINRDDPTTVHDLRVLGLAVDPPELLIRQCDPALLQAVAGAVDGGLPAIDPQVLARLLVVAARPLTFRALIADPDGGAGRLDYRLLGCASTNLAQCVDPAGGPLVELATGTTAAGEFSLLTLPALAVLPGDAGTPLLLEVVQEDQYKGLGGIRLPLVLELRSADGAQHLYAQKLMVYTCQFFPSQTQNALPVLPGPGLTWGAADGGVEDWPEGEVKTWRGTAEVALEPPDFSALEEPYVVPSLTLTPVHLQESWRLAWMTSSGSMGNFQTGGTNFAGVTARHRNTWHPDGHATAPQRVTIWVVVQDGRGGESWITRSIDWSP